MAAFQPELWVEPAGAAVAFYRAAFGAEVLHLVGEGDDVVAQLAVEGAAFWVSAASPELRRFSPNAVGGTTGRVLLAVCDPDALFTRAVAAGAVVVAPMADEYGWRLGRVVDPFGHEWEIGRAPTEWPSP